MATTIFDADVDLQGASRVKNALDPGSGQDLVTLSYLNTQVAQLQTQINNLQLKDPVAAVSTVNIAALTGTPTIDGYATQVNDRILLAGQTTASQNGIWQIPAGGGAWTRPSDFAAASNQTGAAVVVRQGTANAGTVWILEGGTETVDTTAETWREAPAPAVVKTYKVTVGDGAATHFVITHNLGTLDVQVQLVKVSTGATIGAAQVVRTDANTVTIDLNVVPANNDLRVLILSLV